MTDLPARWASRGWRAELEAWLLATLSDAGLTPTGPVVQERIRFWSTVLHVDTDGGRVWVKENAPSQSFEAALVAEVERVAPGRMPPVLAVEPHRGWLATRDVGSALWSREDVEDGDWLELLAVWGGLQRELEPHRAALLATGLSTFPEDGAAAWAADLAESLNALPEADPRRLGDAEWAAVRAGLPTVAAAADELVASGLPASLQHNDLHLGNAFREPGDAMTFIDLGDAVWAHPLTTARIPLWILRDQRAAGPRDPVVRRASDAALEPWTDLVPLDGLRALLPAAERISCLHRAESWRRLVADVPLEVVGPDHARSVPDWLLIATSPDPFATAMAM